MKKIILIGLIIVISVILLLIAVGCIRPIVPDSSFDIIYPADGAVVPTEFSVLGIAARWSFGIEIYPPLFLTPSKSHVVLSSSTVELSVDGTPYARSPGGNHHVFRLTLPEGDHVLELKTPFGSRKITVHVTDETPVRFEPFDRTEEIMERVDGLRLALFDFKETSPTFFFSDDEGTYQIQRIFLVDRGAFILFGAMKERYLWACEVRYLDLAEKKPAAADIGDAPAIFSWDAAERQYPVKIAVVETGGDRLYLVIFDGAVMTTYRIFPDGAVNKTDVSLSDIDPTLPNAIETTFFPEIRTRGYRDFLFAHLDTYQANGPSGRFDIFKRYGATKTVDLDGKDVDGITPDGELITLYPASYVGIIDSTIIGDAGSTFAYFPLPDTGETFSFMGGSVHDIRVFYPERPVFEVAPLVGCIGCTKDYVPPYSGAGGDITFVPDIFKSSIAGHEEYFRMMPPE